MTIPRFLTTFILLTGIAFANETGPSPYKVPDGLVQGGAFIDMIEPMPVPDGLQSDVWGGDNVKPRNARNGIEDAKWSYWCTSVRTGPDGKEHMFVCRWLESSPKGHHEWPRSQVAHAVADNPTGPFKVIQEIGPGHNAEIYQAKDGTYVIYVIDACYTSKSLDGPWTRSTLAFDLRGNKPVNMSNLTFAKREDGSFLMVSRTGQVWVSEDGLKPFKLLKAESVYPKIKGAFEDPVVWRDDVQYHLIVNDWFGRTAYYLRSKDGVNWVWDPGKAYDPDVVRHPDGSKEGWFKLERPKVRQDAIGRATHIYFAVIDCPKDEDKGSDNHSSKSIALPLTVGRKLSILNKPPLSADKPEIDVKVEAEVGFDPFSDVDVESLRFGSAEAVNFGKGARVLRSSRSGKDLVVTFDGRETGLSAADFAAKLLGKSKKGGILFGYASLPGHDKPEAILMPAVPELRRNDKGKLVLAVSVENFGIVASGDSSKLGIVIKPKDQNIISAETTVPSLAPYKGLVVEVPLKEDSLKPGTTCDITVTVNPCQAGEQSVTAKNVSVP